MLPNARKEQLVIREVAADVIVYDRARDRVHRLNPTTALIWRHCDGCTTIADLATRLADAFSLPRDERLVWTALRQLHRAGLLQQRVVLPREITPITRREAIALGIAGAAALLFPACESVTAPIPGVSLDVRASDADITCVGKHDLQLRRAAGSVLVSQLCVPRGQCNFPPRDVFNDLCSQRFDAKCRNLKCPARKTCRARFVSANNLLVDCEAVAAPAGCAPNHVLCKCSVRVQQPFAQGQLVCQCECV